jgi:hypothetical protein
MQIVLDFEGCSSICFVADACEGKELSESLSKARQDRGGSEMLLGPDSSEVCLPA